MNKKIFAAVIVAAVSIHSFASGAIAGATLPEQLVQELTLIDQDAQQVSQLQQQVMMVANQVKNLQGLSMQNWQSVLPLLNQLVSVTGNAKGLAYQTTNTAAAVETQYGDPTKSLSNIQTSMATWTQNTDTQIAAALKQFGMSAGNFQTQQSALNSIQLASQSATGRQQTLQAGNQIAGLMVNQIQSLQSDMHAANQVIMNHIAYQEHAETAPMTNNAPMLAPGAQQNLN